MCISPQSESSTIFSLHFDNQKWGRSTEGDLYLHQPNPWVNPTCGQLCDEPACQIKAKFHYTDPTRTLHGPDTDKVRTRCRVRAKFHYTDPTGPARTLSATHTDPTEFRRKKSPCGSVRVLSGPCRVRVVEFSSSPTMCADFVRVGSGPCRVRVGSVSVSV